MSILEHPIPGPEPTPTDDDAPDVDTAGDDGVVVGLTRNRSDRGVPATEDPATEDPSLEEEAAGRSPFRNPPAGVRGLRIRRVRLRSVAKIASVFFVLGYITVVGTVVAVWNAALAFGFVDTVEETVTTSLGLETFTLDGQALFELVVMGAGLLAVLGLVLTVLLAFVYNAACAVFGGLAVETGPLQRRRRVFSLRDRRFVTIRG